MADLPFTILLRKTLETPSPSAGLLFYAFLYFEPLIFINEYSFYQIHVPDSFLNVMKESIIGVYSLWLIPEEIKIYTLATTPRI